jgi:multiple sugar transport system permease protein
MNAPRTQLVQRWVVRAALTILGGAFLLPLYYLATTAFKHEHEVKAIPPTFWPQAWTLENFDTLWAAFGRPFLNSIIVSTACTVLIVLFSTMAGYALAKKRFFGRRTLFALILATMLIPPSVLIIPLYCIIRSVGLADTLTGLIIPFAVTGFGVFLMRQFAAGIPDELLESAQVDGCGEWAIFWKIVVPFLRPAMAVLAIIEFVNNWNSFTIPFVLLTSPEKQTLQLALAALSTGFEIQPLGTILAGALLTILPILIIFLIFQKPIMGSIMRGASLEK